MYSSALGLGCYCRISQDWAGRGCWTREARAAHRICFTLASRGNGRSLTRHNSDPFVSLITYVNTIILTYVNTIFRGGIPKKKRRFSTFGFYPLMIFFYPQPGSPHPPLTLIHLYGFYSDLVGPILVYFSPF